MPHDGNSIVCPKISVFEVFVMRGDILLFGYYFFIYEGISA